MEIEDFETYNNNDEYGSNMKLFSSNNTNIDDLVNKIIKENTFREQLPSPLRLNIKEKKEAEKEVIVKVNFKGKSLLEKLKRKKEENTANDNNSSNNNNNSENVNQPSKFSLSKENSPNNNHIIESKTKSISPQENENKNIKKEYTFENRNKMRKVEKDVGDSKENNHKHDFTRENGKTSPPLEKSSSKTSEKKKNSNEKIPIQRSVSTDINSEKSKPSSSQSKNKESSTSKSKQETKREKESSPEPRDKKNRASSKKEKIPENKMEKTQSDPKPKRRDSSLSINNNNNNTNSSNRRSSSSTKIVEGLKEERGGSPKKRKRTPSPPVQISPKIKGDNNNNNVKQSPRISATKEFNLGNALLKQAINMKHSADKETDKKKQRIQYLSGGLFFFQAYFKFEEVCSIYESNGKTSDWEKVRKKTIEGFGSVATYFLQNGKMVNEELENLVKSPNNLDENKKKELCNFVSTFYQCAAFCYSKIFQLKSKSSYKKFQSVSKCIHSYSEKKQAIPEKTSTKLCDTLNAINPLIEMSDCWEKAMKWHNKGSSCIENVLDPCFDQVDTFINVQMTKLKK